MLSQQEREYLARLDDLPPRTRGNMLYRIRQKVAAALDETADIILALDAMPPKSARNALDDKHVATAFALSEKMVEVLGYAPIEEFEGRRYVSRPKSIKTTRQGAHDPPIQERTIVTTPASELDEARAHLIAVHLAKLAPYASRPETTRSPLSQEPFAPWSDADAELTPAKGRAVAREWMAEATPARIRTARRPEKKEDKRKGEETTTDPEE
ncbi:hypothetical protein [Candidatus Methanocrinis natronophilus]|uniref:Uncharacterized protein n=1 Tax=Candidatus Methanocrinis natronophilus TaxID=3033396 RepID=A0ABT5XAR6_9EURY|nr:hypothetical protein [Candidatus Methanocrinis natronophilus]MDF0591787.1 hypothetical protein [Candidatus Methanocrinis natronophilus]